MPEGHRQAHRQVLRRGREGAGEVPGRAHQGSDQDADVPGQQGHRQDHQGGEPSSTTPSPRPASTPAKISGGARPSQILGESPRFGTCAAANTQTPAGLSATLGCLAQNAAGLRRRPLGRRSGLLDPALRQRPDRRRRNLRRQQHGGGQRRRRRRHLPAGLQRRRLLADRQPVGHRSVDDRAPR